MSTQEVKSRSFIRIFSITLALITALNALVAGALFIFDPSGKLIGLTTEYLQYSPFSSYLIPGIVLFVVNGVLNILAAVSLMRRKPFAPKWIMVQGVLLGGWILVQVLMVHEINLLHIIMFIFGLMMLISGVLLHRIRPRQ